MTLAKQFKEHKKEATNVLIGFLVIGLVSVLGYAVDAWADRKLEAYVETKALASAQIRRDIRDVEARMDTLELEVQRAKIWVRFLPPEEAIQRQIYTTEIELLEGKRTDLEQERDRLLIEMGATISAAEGD